MKVLFVITSIDLTFGGVSTMTLELAAALGKQGIDVDIVTTSVDGEEFPEVPHDWVDRDAYRVRYFSYSSISNSRVSGALTQWLFDRVGDYDLVQTMGIFLPLISIAHWACQWRRVPYIATPHGMLEPWALAYKARKKQIYLAALDRPALDRASAIYALNSIEAENINRLNFQTKTIVIPNGIHWPDFECLPDPEEFLAHFPETRHKHRILFMARLDPKKGLDLLARAFAKVRAQVPNAWIVIAGPDKIGFLTQVQDYFAAAGCLDAVTFTGMLTGSLKLAALAAANAFVLPSYSEGFSMSVLEAMAAGLPCTITTGCNFPEAGAAGVANVVSYDIDEIADALIGSWQELEVASSMGVRARAFIRDRYTWERITANSIATYREIVANHSPE